MGWKESKSKSKPSYTSFGTVDADDFSTFTATATATATVLIILMMIMIMMINETHTQYRGRVKAASYQLLSLTRMMKMNCHHHYFQSPSHVISISILHILMNPLLILFDGVADDEADAYVDVVIVVVIVNVTIDGPSFLMKTLRRIRHESIDFVAVAVAVVEVMIDRLLPIIPSEEE